MPYSSGTYTLPNNSFAVPVTGTTISSSAAAATFADFVTAFSTCVLKDGTQTITANIPMGGYGFTGLETVAGNVIATQANQETGTATTLVVTPGRQQFHASAAKTWSYFSTDGTQNRSYNMTSVTDNGTGDWSPVIATDFSDANYAVFSTVRNTGSAATSATLVTTIHDTLAAGTFQVLVRRVSDGALADPGAMFVGAFGDQ